MYERAYLKVLRRVFILETFFFFWPNSDKQNIRSNEADVALGNDF